MEHFSTFSPLPNARFRHPEGRMQRRGFIKLTGAAGANLSLQARAQEARHTYRLGFLIPAMRTFAAVNATFDELHLSMVLSKVKTWS